MYRYASRRLSLFVLLLLPLLLPAAYSADSANLTFVNQTASQTTIERLQTGTQVISITNNDNISKLFNFSVQFVGTSATATLNTSHINITNSSTGSLTINISSSSIGTFQWLVVAMLYNNASVKDNSTVDMGTNFVSIIQDTTPPGTVSQLTNLSRGMYHLFWNWTLPSDPDFNNTLVYINGLLNATLNSSQSYYNLSGVANSTSYTLTLHTRDSYGVVNTTNVSTAWTTLQTNRAPQATVTYPNLQTNLSGVFYVNATVTDPDNNASIQSVIFYYSDDSGLTWSLISSDTYNGDTLYSVLWNSTANITYDGEVLIKVNASDLEYSSVDQSDQNSTVDNVRPAAGTIVIENTEAYTTNTSLDFTWSGFSDTGSGIRYLYVNFTDYSGSRNGTRISYSAGGSSVLHNAPQGSVIVYVWAEDYAGNIGSAAYDSIIVDSQDPVITFMNPLAGEKINDNTPVIQINYSDAHLNDSSLTVTINNTLYRAVNLSCSGNNLSYICSVTSHQLDDATNITLSASCRDLAKSQTIAYINFSLNTVAPFYNTTTTSATTSTLLAPYSEYYTFSGAIAATAANVTGTVQENFTIYNASTSNTWGSGAISLNGTPVQANGTTGSVTWTALVPGTNGNVITINLTNMTSYINVTVANGSLVESWRYYNVSDALNITTWQQVVYAIQGVQGTPQSSLVNASLSGADGFVDNSSTVLTGGRAQNTYLGSGYIIINSVNVSWQDSYGNNTVGKAAAAIRNAINGLSAQHNTTAAGDSSGITLTSSAAGPSYPINMSYADRQSGFTAGYNNSAVLRNDGFAVRIDSETAQYINLTTGTNRTASQIISELQSFVNLSVSQANGRIVLTSNTTGTSSTVQILSINDSAYSVLGFTPSTVYGSAAIPANDTFIFSEQDTQHQVLFTPLDTSLTAAQVASQINTITPGFASDDAGFLRLTSNVSGSDSTLVIGNGSANIVLGFTYGQSSNGTAESYVYAGVSRTSGSTNDPVYVWANVSDDLVDGLGAAWVQKNGSSTRYGITAVSGENAFVNITYTLLEEDTGTINLSLYFNDTYGNENSTPPFTIQVSDLQQPDVIITAPGNNSVYNNSFFAMKINVSESSPSAVLCNYSYTYEDGTTTRGGLFADAYTSISGVNRYYATNLESLSDGRYNFTINCTDIANRTTKLIRWFNISDSTAPTGTLTSNSTGTSTVTLSLVVTTDEAGYCRYDSVDKLFVNMSGLMGGSEKVHTYSHEYTEDASGTLHFRCNDTAGNVMATSLDKSFSITITSTSETATSGGGGGGGSSSIPTIEGSRSSKVWVSISGGTIITMDVDNSNIPFKRLEVDVTSDIEQQSEIQVVQLKDAPETSGVLSVLVYQYVKINEIAISDDDVGSVTIDFEVPKLWLENNSVHSDSIALYRYTRGKWWKLKTTKKATHSDSVSYQAVSLGMSYFAIGVAPTKNPDGHNGGIDSVTGNAVDDAGQDQGVSLEDDTFDQNDPDISSTSGDMEPFGDDKTASKKGTSIWNWLLLLLILGGVGVYIFVKKRPPKTTISEENRLKIDRALERHGVHIVHGDLDKLEDFIEDSLRVGRSEEETRQALIEVGWKVEVVDRILAKMR